MSDIADLSLALSSYELYEDEQGAGLTISTLHAAKGLEFQWVFLPGREEGVLPSKQSQGRPEAVAEERRLAFVGLNAGEGAGAISWSATRTAEWQGKLSRRRQAGLSVNYRRHKYDTSGAINSAAMGMADMQCGQEHREP